MLANPFTLKRMGILGMNRRNVDFIARYNNRRYYPLVDDKLKTKQAALKAGISVPELIGVISHQFEIKPALDKFLLLNQFVIKPAQGSGGKGILVIVGRDGDHFLKPSGEVVTLMDIQRHISNTLSGLYSLGGRNDVAMVENLVSFDPRFNDYSYQGVPDIRVIIFKGFPVMAMMRCSTEDSDGKANLHQGAVGVGLDIATGKSLFAVQNGLLIERHPDTDKRFDELDIPHWQTILQLSAACFEMTHLGYLGADIVLDEKLGPLILEVNARPGLAIQIANQVGLGKRLEAVENLEHFELSVDERVQWSIDQWQH
ncbi:alpha-L-glutamate ligase-like protein [Bacterioplanoides sp. SCSIO 12839]|uniref:alpha-L-glutamate ligase-like protein n=1 Tax=Bacterioplanoides sp. SCSIO 12839 TaxID=2829569 RepID=UPI002106B96B|nr:alpha-L-glutamate ligase-like protein [Bacterioplanoides sp. SCSIO 12839]UTW48881.1 alpha-L-glutamate ligase-like protein [Bacterioplanoides sp. SCSIO 12839]